MFDLFVCFGLILVVVGCCGDVHVLFPMLLNIMLFNSKGGRGCAAGAAEDHRKRKKRC